MKKVSPSKLNKIIDTSDLVVVQWCSERAVPCKRQEAVIDQVCNEYKGIDCVKIDIDEHPKARKQYNIEDVYPAVSIYKFGYPQRFRDTKIGNKSTNVIYGERKNIGTIIKRVIDSIL